MERRRKEEKKAETPVAKKAVLPLKVRSEGVADVGREERSPEAWPCRRTADDIQPGIYD
jgi:hypothetical protein